MNGGVFLRGDPEGARRGFEIQIYSPVDAVYPTGSVYRRARSRVSADLEGRWFLMQVLVEGGRVRVWLDGEEAAEMLKFQRAYQASSKILEIGNQLFDTILSLGR